jgi:hypothetical protein
METGQIYTDLTGRFPTASHSGNTYILVLYHYDSNSVLSEPIKNRGDKEMVHAFDLLMDIKNYYLGTPLQMYVSMRMNLKKNPPDVSNTYNLAAISVDGWVYIKIRKGMHGLK